MPYKSRKSSRRGSSGATPIKVEPESELEPRKTPRSKSAELIAISKERRLQLRANLAALTNLMFKNLQLATAAEQIRLAKKSTSISLSLDQQLFNEVGGSIVNEISQPLNAILSNVGAAMNLFGAKSRELREVLADVHNDTVRVCDIVRDMRDLFAGNVSSKSLVQVNAIVQNVVKTLTNEARLCHTSLMAGLGADVPEVCADGVQIEQAITNLVWNGLEAMEDTDPRDRTLVITTRCNESDVEISVSDKGAGISPRAFAHLFETYFTTKPERMGLGLAVARSIAELHQGSITAENNSGPGATFRLRLPIDRANQPAEPALRAVKTGR